MAPNLLHTPPGSTRRSSQGSPPELRREALDAHIVLPIAASALIAAVWIYLALFRGSHAAALVIILGFALLFAGCFSAVAGMLSYTGKPAERAVMMRRRWLARCSLSTFVLLVFYPEYLAKSPPALLRSALLFFVTALLFAILCRLSLAQSLNETPAPDKSRSRAGLLVLLLWFSVLTALSIRKYEVFGYVGQDLAYFGQILYTTVHGHLFWGNLLQDLIYSKTVSTDFAGHNSPIMFLMVPFYALLPHPITLLVLRNVALLACASPVFAIARRGCSNGVAWLWVGVFLLTPAILYQTVFDFYPLTFVALPLLCTVYFYLEYRFTPFCIFLALTLLVREDLVFFAFGLGLIALLSSSRPRKWAYLPVLTSVLWAALSFRVVLPAALHGATFVTDVCFSHLGQTPLQMARRVLLHPRDNVLVHGNIVYLKTLLTATGIVLSGGSLFSVLALPYVGINLLAGAGRCITTVIFAQYSVVPATLLFVGALHTATHARSGRPGARLAVLGRLGLPFASAAPLFLLALCIGSLIFVTESLQVDEFRAKPWDREAKTILTMIPPGTSVAAPRYMLPHLANRDCLYQTHRLLEYHTPIYEYLIVDKDWTHIIASSDYRQEYRAVSAAAAANRRFTRLYDSPRFSVYQDAARHAQPCSSTGTGHE